MTLQTFRRMDRKAFAQTRAQALKAIRRDTNLNSIAKIVGCHVADEYLSPSSLAAWPSNMTIGTALGKSPKTVQRALQALELAGHIRLDARKGRTNLIVFTMIEAKVRPNAKSRPNDGQSCPGEETTVSRDPGQDCPPILTKEPNKEPHQRSGWSFPRCPVPIGGDDAACWERELLRQGLGSLESYDLVDEEDGVAVFVLPARWPPADDNDLEWRRVKVYLEERLSHPLDRADCK